MVVFTREQRQGGDHRYWQGRWEVKLCKGKGTSRLTGVLEHHPNGPHQGEGATHRRRVLTTPRVEVVSRSPGPSAGRWREPKEEVWLAKDRVSRTVVTSTNLLPQMAAATLHWDGRSAVRRELGPPTGARPVPQSSFQAKGWPVTAYRARPYWTTGEICLAPALSPQAIPWEQEAALVTFDLDPLLLEDAAREVMRGATGELVWVHWVEPAESPTPAVYPALLMHAAGESLQADRITIVPYLTAHDPLLQHMALVLQAAIEGVGVAGQLYADALADAFVVHFLRRYAAARQSLRGMTGGLSPYKLRRTTAYIQAHLEQELSLATLAAVAQTSPAHFARLFKHATGLTPHQYVITCRMECAKRLLAETDVPLIEIGLQVGCADQSHFTALFRTHVSLTPKAFRDHARRA
jgi:AraC-like DNA-binding protein